MSPSARRRGFFQEALTPAGSVFGAGELACQSKPRADASATRRAELSSKADAAEVVLSPERSRDTFVKENKLHTCLAASPLRNPELSKSQRKG